MADDCAAGTPALDIGEGRAGEISARELDVLYRESDKIYYEFARGCGLSETAYWILYAVEVSGGTVTQSEIADAFSYSRQTVNSALKSLEAKGLVELSFAAGGRRAKLVSLTSGGRAFCDERIVPPSRRRTAPSRALPRTSAGSLSGLSAFTLGRLMES